MVGLCLFLFPLVRFGSDPRRGLDESGCHPCDDTCFFRELNSRISALHALIHIVLSDKEPSILQHSKVVALAHIFDLRPLFE